MTFVQYSKIQATSPAIEGSKSFARPRLFVQLHIPCSLLEASQNYPRSVALNMELSVFARRPLVSAPKRCYCNFGTGASVVRLSLLRDSTLLKSLPIQDTRTCHHRHSQGNRFECSWFEFSPLRDHVDSTATIPNRILQRHPKNPASDSAKCP